MTRVIFINILLLFTPIMIYGLYVYLFVDRSDGRTVWKDAPVLWLIGAGVIMAIAMLVTVTSFNTASNKGGVYVPPVMRDGKIIPGHIEPKPQ